MQQRILTQNVVRVGYSKYFSLHLTIVCNEPGENVKWGKFGSAFSFPWEVFTKNATPFAIPNSGWGIIFEDLSYNLLSSSEKLAI